MPDPRARPEARAAARMAGTQRLDTPRDRRRLQLHVDPEAAGRVSEQIARFFGTVRYLAIQTVVVVAWIVLNVFAVKLRWDPYPFILLNLAFSTQAAYAAPLILLAQNRQENRDRVSLEEDRARAAQTKADTEFLARELAALRLAVGEVTTRDYLRRELDDLRGMLAEQQGGDDEDGGDGGDGGRPQNSAGPAGPAAGHA